MITPVVARGWFEYADDGALIRHQTEPQAETVTIGQHDIYRRRESSGFTTTTSIPSQIAPLLGILRGIVAGDRNDMAELAKGYVTGIENGGAGWTLTLTSEQQDGRSNRVLLEGCGDVLQAVELQLPDSSRRRYVFEDTS